MTQHSTTAELPPRPQPPSQAECCGNDCAPHCVFDRYERELERWQACCEALRGAGLTTPPAG